MQLNLEPMRAALRHIADFQALAAGLATAAEHPSRASAITHLQLRSCEHLNDAAAACVLDGLSTLRSLDLSNCGGITDATMRRVAQHGAPDQARMLQSERLQNHNSHAPQVRRAVAAWCFEIHLQGVCIN